jgi:hypothetical protein
MAASHPLITADNPFGLSQFELEQERLSSIEALRRRNLRGEAITHEERATLLRAVVKSGGSKGLGMAIDYAKSMELPTIEVRRQHLEGVLRELEELRALVPKDGA